VSSISIIVPCLNEEKNIISTVCSIEIATNKLKIDYEIIVVDDGSKDGTKKIISDYIKNNQRIKLISNSRNEGIGFAFMLGVKESSKDSVIMIPGDNENDAYESLKFIKLLEHVDIIVPFVLNREIRSISRRLLSSVYRLIINISFGMNLNYSNGTVIYKKKILSNIKIISVGFFYQAELLIRLIRSGYSYCEIPHVINQNSPERKSRATTIKSFLNLTMSFCKVFIGVHITRRIGKSN
jgi:dolichol-phosphate mannosyltransferase